jgi:flagellar hook-length control protein FliK
MGRAAVDGSAAAPSAAAHPAATPADAGPGTDANQQGAGGDRTGAQPGGATPTPAFGGSATTVGGASAPAAPSAAASPSGGAGGARYTVGLGDVVDTVQLTVATAARDGFSAARISLSPAELGGVRIEISETSDGLAARVIADHPAAAQVLAQSAGELRSALASAGITLAHLDIGSSAEQARSGADDSASSGRRGGAQAEDPADEDLPTVGSDDVTALQLANGVLIDVFA